MGDNRSLPAESFASVLDALMEGFQVLDFDLRYLYLNEAAAVQGRATRVSLLGRTLPECYPGVEQSELYAHLMLCLKERTSHTFENEFHYPDGSSAHFELRVEPVPQGVSVLSIDISARKQAEVRLRDSEERLRHAQRMESIGMLAAGIAHDFNNLLCVILGHAEIGLGRAEGPHASDLEAVMAAASRSAELTGQLLAFGRRQVLRTRSVDPGLLVSNLASLLRRTLGGDIELQLSVAPPVGCLDIDPGKLEQVVMNLVLNARDAMPRGGKIALSLSEVTLTPEFIRQHPDAAPGVHVLLSVSDTGVGMDRATQARVFEPFFTTKEQGRGTGLGLATVYGIVKQSGGNIVLASELGQGTTFHIYLPRAERESSPPRVPSAPRLLPVRLGREMVLVADDDAALREMAVEALKAAGYEVLSASSGEEVLRMCSGYPITLLLVDAVMPGLSGADLVACALEANPTLKVICTSSYAVPGLAPAPGLPEQVVVLEKPYPPSLLVKTVAAVCAAGDDTIKL
jgi:two-component system cell cycle sensor histidine kinase/response regulator CckA